MRQQESVPAPRGWTGGAAWKGAGASLLLHLFVGAAMIVALSGPPKAPPQVIDLTLLPPAEVARRPVPPAFLACRYRVKRPRDGRPPGTALPSRRAARRESARRDRAGEPVRRVGGEERPRSRISAFPCREPRSRQARVPSREPRGSAGNIGSGTSGAGPSAADFAWIRDAIQHAIAYPATARRMGWEGKVVVSFQLLPDGSVRDVRVVQGSGHAALDRGAIDAVRNASPFPRSPVEAEIITPVVYRLTTR